MMTDKAPLRWMLLMIWLGIYTAGCQAVSPITPVAPSLSPTPLIATEYTSPSPSATPVQTPTQTVQPTSTPTILPTLTSTSLPVYPPITIQNAARLTEVEAIEFGPWYQIIGLEWAPDGSVLVASAGNQLIVIDPQNWDIAARVELDASSPGLAISPDSRYLAAASRDGTISLWDIGQVSSTQMMPIYRLDAHRKGANRVAFSPDGLLLASGGNDAMARIRQVEDGEEIAQIIGGSYAVSDLEFSPDGAWLAIVNSNLIRLRKPESGVMGVTLQSTDPLFCIDISPDGRWLAAGDTASQVLLWDLQAESASSLVGEHAGRKGRVEALIWEVSFNAQGDLLASAGGDGMVQIWDLKAGQPLATLPGHGGAATSVQFSPDGRWLATGDLDGRLRIWGIEE